jgi:hypothetical protein
VGRNVAAAIALLAAAAPGLGDRLGATAAPVLEAVRSDALSERDVALLQRGYYERIFNARRIEAQIRDLEAARPRYWDKSIRDTPVARNTGDLLEYELVPNTAVLFRGRRLTVNRWGMRDREYEQTRPEGSYRVALLGASYAMGSGVDDGETFDAQLEDRLNREADAGETRYEILNLAVDGYSPLQRLMVLERRGFPLHPDAVFYVGHGAEEMAVRRHILRTLEAGIEPSQPFVREALREVGVGLESYGPDADKRLRRRSWDIVAWVYKDIVRQCTERDIVPVWIHMPTLANYGREKVVWRFLAMAERAGFVVISLDGALDGHEIDNLHVAEWDFHPNAAGHQLFADHLFRQLVEHPDLPAFWPARPESVAADE